MKKTFPLKIIIETRAHLDEMKRDLTLLTLGQVGQFMKGSPSSFAWSFVPNPLELLVPWKDLFLLSTFMKYSREQIEDMYVDFVLCYQRIMTLMQEQAYKGFENAPKIKKYKIFDYEKELRLRLQKQNKWENIDSIEDCIDQGRHCLQRLMQMLCNPSAFIYAKNWSRIDLAHEIKYMLDTNQWNSRFTLEFDYWLRKRVRTLLKEDGMKMNTQEKERRWIEDLDLRRRRKIQKKLNHLFLS